MHIFFCELFVCAFLFVNVCAYHQDENNKRENFINVKEPESRPKVFQKDQKFSKESLFKNCIFKETSDSLEKLLGKLLKKSNEEIFNFINKKENVKENGSKVLQSPFFAKLASRKTRQAFPAQESSMDWSKCALRSELQEHALVENIHIASISQEIKKLQQLVRLLQDQQYILNILKDFDNKPKSEDIGDQKQLIRLLQLLKNNIPQKNELETNFIPQGKSENFISVEKPKPRHEKPLIESHENITNLVHELNQLKHLIVNKSLQEVQNKNEGEKLQHELDNQKHLLEELKNRIEHLKSNKTTEEAPKLRQSEGENQVEMIQQQLEELEGKLSEFMAKHPSSEQNIVGASLPNQNHTPTLLEKLRNPKPFSRKSEDEDDLETLFSNLNNQDKPKPKILQKHLHNLSPSKNKLKPRANEEDFVENLQRLLSDPDQTLEPKQNSFAFKEAAPALEDRLGNLQKRMEVLKKIQKLEKKVKELHEDEAESKSNSDDDDSVKKQLKTMMREIKKLNKEQIEGKDADDLQNEFKNLQAEINNLKPNDEEDSSFGKIGKVSDVQFMLNKIFQQGEVIQPVPVPHVPHSLHLSPAQIQLLKTKLIQMRHGPQHPEPFLPQPGPVPVPSLYTHGGYYGQHGNPTALYGIGQYEAGLYGAAPYDKYGSPGGGNYGSASGDAAYGSYGSTSGKYGNQYTNMLHGLLETQYGSGGKYGSGSSGLYGTGDALYGAGPYASSGGASYGASNALYGNDGGGYEAGSSYGPGGKPYGSGGGLYGPIATAPYGANPYASTSAGGAPYESPRGGYGSVAAPYSKAYSPSPYGSASGSYGSSSGSYGSTSGPYGIVSGSHSGSYGSISGPYGSSSGTYGSGTGPYGSSNRAYGSAHGSYGSASGSYGVTGGPYGSATGPYGATGRPYGSSGAYGASNEQYGHNGAAYGSNTGQYGSSSPYGADAEPYGGNGRPYGSGSGSYKSGSESYGSENVAYGSSGNPYASAVAPYKNPTLYEDSSYNSGGKPYGSSHGGGGGIYSSEGGSAVKSYNSGPAGNTYGTSSGQYQPNANKYGPNDQQYGSGNQQYATSAVNDGGKLYGSKPGIQYAAGSNSYKPPMYSSSSPPAPHNSYNQPNQPIYPNKPAYTNHDVNVHAVFENMAHSYQDDPKPQFFPSYKGSKGYGPNDAANYPPTTNSNGPNSQQPYANPSHNPTVGDSYAQQKVNELKTQIYGLENVINNLSGPEYTQKPGDQEMKRELDHKIDYLKHMVRDLSKDAPGSSYAPGSRSDQAYNPYGDPEPNDEEEYSNRRKREAPTNKPPSAMEDFFDYLNNIMSVVQYYTEGWPKGNQTEEEQKIRSTRQSNQDGEVPKETLLHIFDQFNNLVNIVNDLSANISKNNFSCVQNKTCVNDQIKSTIKQLSDQPIVSAIRKRRQVQAEEDDDSGDVWKTVSSVFKGMVSDINNQESGDSETVALHSPDPLQQKLEDLKKQLDSKVNHRLPFYNQHQRAALNSPANPFQRSSYYSQPTYYTPQQNYYYPQPYYYQQPSYDYDDKKDKDKSLKIKLKKASKKNDIFGKILDKILDKIEIAIPKVIRRLLSISLEDLFSDGYDYYSKDDYGGEYGGNGYDQKGYGVKKGYKKFGIFSYIPMLIIKLFSKLTAFVQHLRKNKFLKTFLVPALVAGGSAGLVIFLVWWLTGDDYAGYGNYDKGDYYGGDSYGYGGYDDSGYGYRSSNMENSYNKNNYYGRNDYGANINSRNSVQGRNVYNGNFRQIDYSRDASMDRHGYANDRFKSNVNNNYYNKNNNNNYDNQYSGRNNYYY